RVTGRLQVGGHARAHDAESDESHVHVGSPPGAHLGTRRRGLSTGGPPRGTVCLTPRPGRPRLSGGRRVMALTFRKLHPHFAAEVSPVDLRRVHDPETLAEIRAGMDEYAVLVFHDQPFTDPEQLDFAQRLDGLLHTKLGSSAIQ